MHDTSYGIKLGSQWTVGYGLGIDPEDPKLIGPRQELTCVHQTAAHLLKKSKKWRFSREADQFDGCKYPLEFGLPVGDNPREIAKSCLLLGHFVDWLLKGTPDETGIVFCLPMMKYEEGMERLKAVINKQSKGSIGKRYIMEAWAAALATVGIEKSLDSRVISLNFGSSTLEAVLYVGRKMVAQNVYPFGGWAIDREMQAIISQAKRGILVTQRQAREVKEQYNYETKEAVDGLFTKGGRMVEAQVTKNIMDPILEAFAKTVAYQIVTHFLPGAAQENPLAVTALQSEGQGFLCVCGGLSDMPGFPQLIADKLVEVGALNPHLPVTYPEDPNGVTAPAYGAYLLADMLEDERKDKKKQTW